MGPGCSTSQISGHRLRYDSGSCCCPRQCLKTLSGFRCRSETQAGPAAAELKLAYRRLRTSLPTISRSNLASYRMEVSKQVVQATTVEQGYRHQSPNHEPPPKIQRRRPLQKEADPARSEQVTVKDRRTLAVPSNPPTSPSYRPSPWSDHRPTMARVAQSDDEWPASKNAPVRFLHRGKRHQGKGARQLNDLKSNKNFPRRGVQSQWREANATQPDLFHTRWRNPRHNKFPH